MVSGGSGRDGSEETIDRGRSQTSTGSSHGGGSKVVAATVPTIGHGSFRVLNSRNWNVVLSIVQGLGLSNTSQDRG